MILRTFLSLTGLLLLGSCQPATNQGQPYLGTWVVSSYRSAPISALTDEESDEWIGKKLILASERASFEGELFPKPEYMISQVSVGKLLDRWPGGAEALQLREEFVPVLQLSRDIRPVATLLVASDDRLLTYWDGVVFELTRKI